MAAYRCLVEGTLMNIRNLSLTITAALLSAHAFAADLPTRRVLPPFAPKPPAFTWTGFYAGFQLGGEFGTSNVASASTATGGTLDMVNGRKNGLIGGGHIGYLFSTQSSSVLGGPSGLNGTFGPVGVAGFEVDVDGSSARANYALLGAGVADSAREGVQGSLRGRLGIAFDRALFYATGGVALGGLDTSDIAPGGAGTDQFSQVKVGYTVGGGVEYAFTDTVSARAEYRYTDFGSFTNNLANSTGGLVSVTHRETNNRVQAGVSVKFDALPASSPVVARY